MYLFVRGGTIVGFALNKRMALVGEILVVDEALAENPHPGAILQYIPDQKRGWMFEQDIEGNFRNGLRYPDDVPFLPTDAEVETQIDYETQCAVNLTMHPKAWQGEQIAALREQIAQMLIDSGKQPIERFKDFNDCAGAEIAKGQEKKDVLKK